MSQLFKILMLEDSDADAEIVERRLRKENIVLAFEVCYDESSFREMLETFQPDVILADNSLPQFDAREALKIVQQQSPFTPFIMVTGSVSEEFAAGIIKLGADDYILKDRLVRLPAAIESAVNQRRARKETLHVLEQIRISNDRFETLSKATRDAVWDWNLQTDEVWWNVHFFNLLGYDPSGPVPSASEWTKHMHPEDVKPMLDRLRQVKENTIGWWEEEFRFKMKDGTYGTLLDRTYIIRDAAGVAVRAVGALVNITEQKRLLQAMMSSRIEQQKEINRTILQTQEMERNALGRELHDNINQILASVSLKLAFFLEEPSGNLDVINSSFDSLQKAIQEARNLSHHMVMPRFSEKRLKDELERLIENYQYGQMVLLILDDLEEAHLSPALKETVYRIVQEQLSNIHKHARANEIMIRFSNDATRLELLIHDNGIGFDAHQKSKGIGLSNIFNRIESFNGTAQIESVPGDGCSLTASIPLQV